MLGRYGRVTSSCTAGVVGFCIVQNLRVLTPCALAMVHPDSWSALVLRILACFGLYLTVLVPFNFIATMYSSPGHASGEEASHMLQSARSTAGEDEAVGDETKPSCVQMPGVSGGVLVSGRIRSLKLRPCRGDV